MPESLRNWLLETMKPREIPSFIVRTLYDIKDGIKLEEDLREITKEKEPTKKQGKDANVIRCILCKGESGKVKLLGHHLQYVPVEIKVPLCTKCHSLIHKNPFLFPGLNPLTKREG